LSSHDFLPINAEQCRDDVCGVCAFDIPPSYGIPTRHLPFPEESPVPPSEVFLDIIRKWSQMYPDRKELMTVLHDLFGINARINVGMPAVWDDPFFLGMQINPLILRLLPPAHQTNESGGTIETACRLGGLVYLGDIRTEFVMYHVTGYHFVEKLKQIILIETTEWEEFQNLRLWRDQIITNRSITLH
jgi:hypothetical protein